MQTRPEFWQDRKVLMTGHTGFKGSWLCLWLQAMGAELRGIALQPPTTPALFDVAQVANGMDSRIADIRDASAIARLVKDFQPEIVIHMAAQPLVRLSYQQPIETYATNVMGTVHVLEAARHAGSVRAIVNITTDKCYDNREWAWGYREDEPMGGHDPYSSSKGCAELVSSAYRKSFLSDAGIAMAIARAGNVIGGGDWALDRLVPDTLLALEKGQPVQIRNPHATRPWQHVLEPLSGYLMLAEKLHEQATTQVLTPSPTQPQSFAEGWNFGPRDEDARPVHWIVDHLCQAWGQGASWQLQPGDHSATEMLPSLTYPISKAAATTACLGLARHLGLRMQVLRIFQVFGEGETATRFWPSLRSAALEGRNFAMSSGVQIRDLVEVTDVASQFLSALSFNGVMPGKPQLRNIGTGRAQTLLDFASAWWAAWGATGKLKPGQVGLRPGELSRVVANVDAVHVS